MSVAALRNGLANQLGNLPEIQVSAYVLSNPTPPTVWVSGIATNYDKAYGSRTTGQKYTDEYTAMVQAFVPMNDDIANQQLLDNLLASSGAFSVKTLIEADKTLGGACDTLWVESSSLPALSTYQNVPLLMSEWTVTIIATEVAL